VLAATREGQKPGRTYFAPVNQPKRILDVACGTAIWALGMTQRFRQAQVYGFDADPLPVERRKRLYAARSEVLPPNFHFQEANALQRFPWSDGYFDYTFTRFAGAFIPEQRWPQVLAEMVRVTRQGGYVEVIEGSYPTCAGKNAAALLEAIQALVSRKKLHPNVRQFLVPLLEGAGLTNIETKDILMLPGGKAQLQRKLVKNVYLGFRSIRPALLNEGILTAPVFASLMRGIQEEMLRHGISWIVTAAWGKRP
jgi:ubiquinone/menaquinone biosynthesis C-methylase UbiE